MASADNWPLNFTGVEFGYPFVDIGDGVRVFDVRGRYSDHFDGGSGTEKIGFAVHHAVGGLGSGSLEGDLAVVDGIHAFHVTPESQGRGWPGIGYHRIIGAGKRVYMVGSSASVRAHVANLNHLWIGVCFLGTWTNSRPDEDRMTAFKRLVQWETDQRGMPMQLAPHKRLNPGTTACPGGWAAIDAWQGTTLQPMALAPPTFEPPAEEIDDFQRGRIEVMDARDLIEAQHRVQRVELEARQQAELNGLRAAWGIRSRG